MDRGEMARIVGRRVIVGLKAAGAGSTELVAKLAELRDDGIVLADVNELGPGPTVFCPWDSLRSFRNRPPWLGPPEEAEAPAEVQPNGDYYDVRESVPAAVVDPEPPVERRRSPSARTLEHVVPIARKQTVGETTVALTSLEVHGEGLGVLWWRVSFEVEPLAGGGIPEPEFRIRSVPGRELPWWPRGSGAGDGEADGEIEVEDLPDAGDIEVVVSRLVFREWVSERGEEEELDSYEGPWSFRFSL